ncbi:hypothetical protein LCGC14_1125680 [marine sediment metagenome]|uniref:EamA domain-containing protein n=1 Tax=marine sediment metagenome TaxID=412755 RepID=A0A0F9M2N3_9ZZZZ
MQYLIWSALASFAVVSLEFFFRRGLVWHENLVWLIPAAILSNFLIYKLVTTAPTYIMAFPAFALMNLALRMGISHFMLDEPIHRGNLVAVVALAAAIGVGNAWK